MAGMKRLALCAALLCGSAVAADPAGFSVSLEAKKVHEECQRIDAKAKRKFHWKSDVPVDFNIHYHQGSEVFYPVKRNAMRGDGGTFTAKTAQEYCWMWTARDAAAKIEGSIEK